MRLYVALLGMASLMGCYSPAYVDCAVTCPDGQTCPSGYKCKSGMCRRPDKEGPCGTSEDDAGIDAPPQIAITDFHAAMTTAMCDRGVRCGAYESVEACLVLTKTPRDQAHFDSVVLAVTQGKVAYHEDMALECLNAISQLGCVRDEPLPRQCTRATTGVLAGSAACAFDSECVSGVCLGSDCPGGDCCNGTCAGDTPPADKTQLQSCTRADHCIGSYCDQSATMASGICMPYTADGDTCDPFKFQCAPGSACRETLGLPPEYRCQSLVVPGQLCKSNNDCRDLSNVCTSEGGERKCLVSGLANTTCSDPNSADCQAGHRCDGLNCIALPGPTESCFANNICRYDAYCVGGTCTERLMDGEVCDMAIPGGNCESYRCVNGVCEPFPVCT